LVDPETGSVVAARIAIKLKPGAKNTSIKVKPDRSIDIYVTSRPIEGKANDHLIRVLSDALHISKSSCTIIRGAASRNKLVAIEGLAPEEIYSRLSEAH
jgi:uncharacterized protein (TIGR00251 family)